MPTIAGRLRSDAPTVDLASDPAGGLGRSSADVIIAARDEESRVEHVVRAALGAANVHRVLVVVNGSRDSTAEVCRSLGVDVLELEEANKGAAVLAALDMVDTTTVCLLDADLKDLTSDQVDALIRPALRDTNVMTFGILPNRRGNLTLKYSSLWLLSLSGQRACSTALLRKLDPRRARGYRLEASLNTLARNERIHVERIGLEDVQHVRRELKEFPVRKPIKWLTIAHCYLQYSYLLGSEIIRYSRRSTRPINV